DRRADDRLYDLRARADDPDRVSRLHLRRFDHAPDHPDRDYADLRLVDHRLARDPDRDRVQAPGHSGVEGAASAFPRCCGSQPMSSVAASGDSMTEKRATAGCGPATD